VPEGLSLVYKFIHNISMLKTVADRSGARALGSDIRSQRSAPKTQPLISFGVSFLFLLYRNRFPR